MNKIINSTEANKFEREKDVFRDKASNLSNIQSNTKQKVNEIKELNDVYPSEESRSLVEQIEKFADYSYPDIKLVLWKEVIRKCDMSKNLIFCNDFFTFRNLPPYKILPEEEDDEEEEENKKLLLNSSDPKKSSIKKSRLGNNTENNVHISEHVEIKGNLKAKKSVLKNNVKLDDILNDSEQKETNHSVMKSGRSKKSVLFNESNNVTELFEKSGHIEGEGVPQSKVSSRKSIRAVNVTGGGDKFSSRKSFKSRASRGKFS